MNSSSDKVAKLTTDFAEFNVNENLGEESDQTTKQRKDKAKLPIKGLSKTKILFIIALFTEKKPCSVCKIFTKIFIQPAKNSLQQEK